MRWLWLGRWIMSEPACVGLGQRCGGNVSPSPAEQGKPAQTFHAGEFICEELAARGWSIETLVALSGCNRERWETLLAGKRALTLLDAQGLSLAFGTGREIWINLQKSFDPIKRAEDNWNILHQLMECGHPRACWQDENWPASEQNYDAESRTSEPPIVYRCVACVDVAAAEQRGRLAGWEEARQACHDIALVIDSNRGNEKEIAKAIAALTPVADHGRGVDGRSGVMDKLTIDPKRTGVKAHLTTADKINVYGEGYDIRGEPGGMIPSVNDQGVIEGFSIACPGCGAWGGIRFVADEHFKNPWRVTGGSVDDVTTLTVRNSILKHCCGWHGFLNCGVFELEAR